MIKLDLGCGKRKLEGCVGIDRKQLNGVDIAMNLDGEDIRLPYEDGAVDEVRAFHLFEHIVNFIPLMNEIYRVLKSGGRLILEVPIAGTYAIDGTFIFGAGAFRDPTHVRYFLPETFYYFTNGYMGNADYDISAKFSLDKARIYIDKREGHMDGVNMGMEMVAEK